MCVQMLDREQIRKEAFEEAAKLVEDGWNHSETMVNEQWKVRRLAKLIRELK